MSARHTPGPWRASRDANENLKVFGGKKAICFMGFLSSDDNDASDIPNAEANARLIALAPEMESALRDLHADARIALRDAGLDPYQAEAVMQNIGAKARALLAKLDGAKSESKKLELQK